MTRLGRRDVVEDRVVEIDADVRLLALVSGAGLAEDHGSGIAVAEPLGDLTTDSIDPGQVGLVIPGHRILLHDRRLRMLIIG